MKGRVNCHFQAGQALVVLIMVIAVAMTITTGAVIVTVVNSTTTSKYALGEEALMIAQSGVENAILRLLRDPDYTGETLSVGYGTATITVSGTPIKTITSVSSNSGFKRTIQVIGTLSANEFLVTSWAEI